MFTASRVFLEYLRCLRYGHIRGCQDRFCSYPIRISDWDPRRRHKNIKKQGRRTEGERKKRKKEEDFLDFPLKYWKYLVWLTCRSRAMRLHLIVEWQKIICFSRKIEWSKKSSKGNRGLAFDLVQSRPLPPPGTGRRRRNVGFLINGKGNKATRQVWWLPLHSSTQMHIFLYLSSPVFSDRLQHFRYYAYPPLCPSVIIRYWSTLDQCRNLEFDQVLMSRCRRASAFQGRKKAHVSAVPRGACSWSGCVPLCSACTARVGPGARTSMC